jgi:hypothetical protein
MSILNRIVTAAIDFYWRAHPSVALMRSGSTLLAFAALGVGIQLRARSAIGSLDLAFDGGGGPVVLGLFFLGAIAFTVGAVWLVVRHVAPGDRSRIVLEQRGLPGKPDSALRDALPVGATIYEVLTDIRGLLKGSAVADPDAALSEVTSSVEQYRRLARGHTRSSLIYGGLITPPMAFLTGVLLDDDGAISVYDWDRELSKWRALEAGVGPDNTFVLSDLSGINPANTVHEVVLAVSCSYPADMTAIGESFSGLPVIELAAETRGVSNHWDADVQAKFASAFLGALIELKGRGVTLVHVVLAAQNSVAFRLGRAFDRRNLMPAIVYHYEANTPSPYPWGVRMPTNADSAQVVRR